MEIDLVIRNSKY